MTTEPPVTSVRPLLADLTDGSLTAAIDAAHRANCRTPDCLATYEAENAVRAAYPFIAAASGSRIAQRIRLEGRGRLDFAGSPDFMSGAAAAFTIAAAIAAEVASTDRACSTCNGTAVVHQEAQIGGSSHSPWITCPDCGPTPSVAAEEPDPEPENTAEDWQRGDVVLDDTGNLFCYHNLHGWFGLASNQTSARGHYERDEMAEPLTLLVRGRQAVGCHATG